jgi:hypothetical protein
LRGEEVDDEGAAVAIARFLNSVGMVVMVLEDDPSMM